MRLALVVVVSMFLGLIAQGSSVYSSAHEARGAAAETRLESPLPVNVLQLASGAAEPSVAPDDRKDDIPLANGQLRDLVKGFQANLNGPTTVNLVGSSVRVEILHDLSSDAIRALVAEVGGQVYGDVPGQLVEALVPVDRLVDLEAAVGVKYLRPPLRVDGSIDPNMRPRANAHPAGGQFIGEEVLKTNAQAWHQVGIMGQGVKIGIIDSFDQSAWSQAQAVGEVPAPSGTFCSVFGFSCSIWDREETHGVAVAEIIHEMASSATLYLASVYTAADMQAAVNYFSSQGVKIISRSETAEYDGPGDGTGPMAAVVNSAVSDGILWVNSAGNAAKGGFYTGGYWRGNWSDNDANGYLNFSGSTELLTFYCGFVNGVRWSDWTSSSPTDYDVEVYDDPFGIFLKTRSVNNQPGGADPVENFNVGYQCSDDEDVDYLAIKLFDPGGGTAGDTIEFMTNTQIPQFTSNPYSASGPMSDSANPGMISVGAVDPANGTKIADYSSWGPTNDGRTKPDLSAASCVDSYTNYPVCFAGTSAAAPAVAGAAALVLSGGQQSIAGLANDPAALATYLKNATVDRGQSGPDNVYGRGELRLPNPSGQGTPTPTPSPTVAPGQHLWGDADCSQSMAPRDGQAILKNTLQQAPLSQTPPCPAVGSQMVIGGMNRVWGDFDCSGAVAPRDGQAVLKNLLSQVELSQTEPCPDIAMLVTTGSSTPTRTPTSSPTHTQSPSPTPTHTPTTTPTRSPTRTPTPTRSPTRTPSPTPTHTSTASPTKTPSPTPPRSPTPTPHTATPTPSPVTNDCSNLNPAENIPDNNAVGTYLTFNIPDSHSISNAAICINIDHTWVGDLMIVLTHENTGTSVTLVARVGNPAFTGNCSGNGSGMYVLLQDFESQTMQQHCTSETSEFVGFFKPDQAMAAFAGEDMQGTWTLYVADLFPGDTGVILGSRLWFYY